jgi:3-hydroxyacyl-CoA dehydrogenase/enoyl-CoA hydratase/3-hydroxybutyryl-CoA epimerase
MTDKNHNNWKVNEDSDGIVWLHLDKADSNTNVLSAEVLEEFDALLNTYSQQPPRGLIILSDKDNGFIAGADVKEFNRFNTEDEAREAINRGHKTMNQLEALSCPTVAVLHGFTLGGGLELALACRYRVTDDDPATKLGLPEVKLGIHPGFGGTVRCIERVGPLKGMDLMLSGRNLSVRAAKNIGLVDYAVPRRHLHEAARQTILNPPPRKSLPFWMKLLNHPKVRPWLAKLFIKKVSQRVRRAHYPAPYALIDLWQHHASDRQQMLREEATSVARLLTGKTAQNLIRVFMLQEQLKGLGRLDGYHPKHVHVVGGGIMGGDIAAWCALQGMNVTIQDQRHESLAAALQRAYALYKKRLKQPRLVNTAMDRLMPDINGNGLVKADIVIEAIFEDVDAKRQLFREIEPKLKTEAVIATNTSSIPLEQLAEALQKPDRLVGLHFFNPVAKMPLVEIVHGQQTAADTRDKASAFAKKVSRLPLPVTSTPGFLVNRVLMPYLIEAVTMADEGVPLKVIDQSATDFGMPMGPIELADTVGLDICLNVAEILSQHMDIAVPKVLQDKVSRKQLGKKTGTGFYKFKKGKPVKPGVDKNYKPPTDLQDRLIMRMLNEIVACLREDVVENGDLADAGIIFGTGFAPFRGGPVHYIHDRGPQQLEKLLDNLTHRYGERFQPDAGWTTLIEGMHTIGVKEN